LRSFLAKFLFVGDDVYKRVRDLSGGEKGRLVLAKLIYSGANVLVLDEPTNHLDIPSREALEEALAAYEGTIVTISHDRFFLDRVATQMLALFGDGRVEHYNGDYTEYHNWKAGSGRSETDRDTSTGLRPSGKAAGIDGAERDTRKRGQNSARSSSPQAASPNLDPKRIKVIKKPRDSQAIEAEITQVEGRMKDLSDQMSSPEVSRDITKLVKANEEYRQAEARLAELMAEWERAETVAAGSNKRSSRRR